MMPANFSASVKKRTRRIAIQLLILVTVFATVALPVLTPAAALAQDAAPAVTPVAETDATATPAASDAPADASTAEAAAPEVTILEESVVTEVKDASFYEGVVPSVADAPGTVRSSVRIEASQDAYISSRFSNTNFGRTTNLNLGWQQGGEEARRILIQFNLSSIPRNAVIERARWNLFQFQVIPVGDANMDFRAQFMQQPWNETAVTWNNANFLGGDSLPLGSVPGTIGWQSGDATDVVRAWVSGQRANNGVLITGDETPARNRSRLFNSRESNNRPFVTVDFQVNCDTIAPTASVQALPGFSPGEFVVRWSGQDLAPSGCAPSGIANFDVEYRVNGGAWVQWRNRTTSTQFTFRNLAPNNAFVEFRARATDRAGNVGAFTGPQASTRVDTQPPVATVNPLPQWTPFSSFVVTWGGSDNLSGIATYDIEFAIDNGSWQMLIEGTTQTSYQVTGAVAGQTYRFRARATDNVGNSGSWPATEQAETFVLTFPVVRMTPFEPPIIKPTSPVTDSFTVRWEGITAPGSTITQYQIFYNYNGQGRVLWQTFPGTTTTAVFPFASLGLGDGAYEFDGLATNSFGQTTGVTGLSVEGIIVDLANVIQPRQFLPAMPNFVP
jgi:hypothetical protein